jgi:hypothetical protein
LSCAFSEYFAMMLYVLERLLIRYDIDVLGELLAIRLYSGYFLPARLSADPVPAVREGFKMSNADLVGIGFGIALLFSS